MNSNSGVSQNDRKEKPSFLVKVNNIEKQLWALINSKGILHPDVGDLYEKAGSTYEKIFTSDLKHEDLQDVEFSLWKLHYKHIDEFRKGLKVNPQNSESKRLVTDSHSESKRLVTDSHSESKRLMTDSHMEAFKSFLSRATEFYSDLITKVRRHYGVSENLSAKGEESVSHKKCRFLCHRFYICLGDLARYKEQYLKIGDHPNWSAAASHYMEAAVTWPDSGNPHNQLAVLATYVGDEFLALYHCVRSLAVKEPFPGAWNNLLLLFEKNRSSPLQYLSVDARFDYSNPSERSGSEISNPSESNREFIAGTNMWVLLVRTTSFFFLKSSLEEFPCAFASTMRALDSAFAADDEILKDPFRFLQLVTVFIFIFNNLTVNHKENGSYDKREAVTLMRLALSMAFVIMGQTIERCLRKYPLDYCPILPAILVFLEYLPFVLDKAEESGLDEESETAISYFFGALVDLLNELNVKGKYSSPDFVALWEDHELRAFAPLASIHAHLDFSSHGDLKESFDRGNELRLERIRNSAIEIANRQQKGSQKWILWDEQGTRFYTASNISVDTKVADATQHEEEILCENGENNGKCEIKLTQDKVLYENDTSVPAEEEEVILLKPLARCKSAPICSSGDTTKDHKDNVNATGNQTSVFDDSLRRTASLFADRGQQNANSSSFSFIVSSTETESPHSFLEGGISGRPPSLSAWVIEKDNKDRGRFGGNKHNGLSPIDETVPVTSFHDLSISNNEHSFSSSTSFYSPPTPSAPLIPENASWFHESTINKADNTYEQIGTGKSGLLNYGLPLPGFIKPYSNPPFVGISSSEWLRRYRESQNLGQGSYSNTYSYQAQATNNMRNFVVHESSKFSLLDRYGTPGDHQMKLSDNSLFYPGFDNQLYMQPDYESKGEKQLHGYQKSKGVGFGDLSNDPMPLLQYLKEKEWLREHNQRLRGPSPAYMNN